MALLCAAASSATLFAQTTQPPAPTPAPNSNSGQIVNPKPASTVPEGCVQPEPLISIGDYDGPFKKAAGYIARKLERRAVHQPHFKPGARLCALTTGEKFRLFVDNSIEPLSFLGAGFSAGVAQAENDDPSFGQGAEGYGKRLGAAFTDQASSNFFKEFLYPTIFSEDPRYYRMAHGPARKRVFHALEHVFVAHTDSGSRMFNFSEWMGTISAQSLSNLYHPGNRRGFYPSARGVTYSLAFDMGFDVLREFTPDIYLKLKIPFIRRHPERLEHEPIDPSK